MMEEVEEKKQTVVITDRNHFQFTYKAHEKDLMSKDYKIVADSAIQALESFNRDRPGAVFIAMWDNSKM